MRACKHLSSFQASKGKTLQITVLVFANVKERAYVNEVIWGFHYEKNAQNGHLEGPRDMVSGL